MLGMKCDSVQNVVALEGSELFFLFVTVVPGTSKYIDSGIGMSASLAPECSEVKERYDSCFLKWYSEKYLRGTAKSDECEPLFRQYKTCLSKALKERGIDQMVEEARSDNKENDAEYLKPSKMK